MNLKFTFEKCRKGTKKNFINQKIIKKMIVQLQIDFLIPYELTPTKEEIEYTVLKFGVFDVPYTEVISKRKKRRY